MQETQLSRTAMALTDHDYPKGIAQKGENRPDAYKLNGDFFICLDISTCKQQFKYEGGKIKNPKDKKENLNLDKQKSIKTGTRVA